MLWLSAGAPAAELHSDGAINFRIGLSRRWNVLVHNRARVRSNRNDWYDVGIIPLFRHHGRPKVQLSAGAFSSWFEYPNNDWQRHFRPVVAIEPTVLRKPVTLALRTQAERFWHPPHVLQHLPLQLPGLRPGPVARRQRHCRIAAYGQRV